MYAQVQCWGSCLMSGVVVILQINILHTKPYQLIKIANSKKQNKLTPPGPATILKHFLQIDASVILIQ